MFAALNSFQVGGKPTFVSDVFSTSLYTGNGSTQTITNSIDLSTKGGLVWIKGRNNATNNLLFDTNRGVNNYLVSDTNSGQSNPGNSLSAFNTNGFTVQDLSNFINETGFTYVSWTFRQAPKFFDVVTWSGDGSASQTIPHNLESTPGCIMVKKTSAGGANWFVYHQYSENNSGTLGENGYLNLNTIGNLNYVGTDVWTPTSTTFQANETYNFLNSTGETYVAYLFANNAGGFGGYGADNIITCGSTNGSKVTLGYQPQWILYKSRDFSEFWQIVDSQRGMPAASPAQLLKPNTSDAETTTTNNITIESDGFTLGAVTGTVIYIAIKAS